MLLLIILVERRVSKCSLMAVVTSWEWKTRRPMMMNLPLNPYIEVDDLELSKVFSSCVYTLCRKKLYTCKIIIACTFSNVKRAHVYARCICQPLLQKNPVER